METSERNLLDRWMENWSDIVDFEIFPVLSSKEAADRSHLGCDYIGIFLDYPTKRPSVR